MKVCIIGLGYVGLTLAVYLARKGAVVYGVDISPKVIGSLETGRAHFYETNFDHHLSSVLRDGSFTFGSGLRAGGDSESHVVYIITVGTPLDRQGKVNLQPLTAVSEDIGTCLRNGDLVMLRSTVRVGVTREVVKPILDASSVGYHLAFCPERTLEGRAFEELASLPQIISGIDDHSLRAAKEFFGAFDSESVALESVEEAEMVKLLNNSERDLMFSLANEIALMCDAKGLNAHRIIEAANYRYPRSNLRRPGPVGGPCLEKDPHILTEGFVGGPYVPKLFRISREINSSMINTFLSRIFGILEECLGGAPSKVAILGFAFKGTPPTGDIRGSLVGEIIKQVRSRYISAKMVGHDYLADPLEIEEMGVFVCRNVQSAVRDCELVIIQNNHPLYRQEAWPSFSAGTDGRPKVIADFWNQLSSTELGEGVLYRAFGDGHGKA